MRSQSATRAFIAVPGLLWHTRLVRVGGDTQQPIIRPWETMEGVLKLLCRLCVVSEVF